MASGVAGGRGLAPAALITALIVAACGSTASTPEVSPTPTPEPSPSPSVTLQPTPVPSADVAYEQQAIAIIEALGGTVPADEMATVTYGDSIAGAASVHVALGDWQMAWDGQNVLRHVFWEQYLAGATPPASALLDETQVRDRVDAIVAALDLSLGAPEELVAQEETWMAAWPRVEDEVPVEENGTRIWVNKDGTFLQYTYNWNELGPKPGSTISAEQAIEAVQDCGGETGPAATCEADLVWHLPQTQPGDAPLILCWIVGPKGGNGDWRVWVDAGTGEIVDVAAMLN
jgi:hypothetical protein